MKTVRVTAMGALCALFCSLLVASPARAADACWNPHKAELGFTRQLNAARANDGLGNLSLDPELSKAARVHTREMIRRSAVHHTSDSKLRYRVTNWAILGENVGAGGSVGTLHDAFMASPTHRANIMGNAYRHVGIGALYRNGRLWVTVLFEGTTDPGTPLRMPTC